MRIRVLPDTDFACGLYCRYKNFFLTKILALELKVLHICRSFKSFFTYIISRFFKLTKVWRVFESGSKSQNVRFGSATLNVLKNMPSTVCGIHNEYPLPTSQHNMLQIYIKCKKTVLDAAKDMSYISSENGQQPPPPPSS